MSFLVLLACAAAALAAVLANIGIWSPRKLWVKLSAVTAVALFLPITYFALTELLSHPKPMTLEWAQRSLPQANVISAQMIEDKAIYLWLGFEGEEQPRSYSLPWTRNMAEQLQEAQREAEANGTGVMVSMPFELTMDSLEKKFYAAPQKSPPPKEAPGGGPLVFKGTQGRGDMPLAAN
jgi:hypothetical protein